MLNVVLKSMLKAPMRKCVNGWRRFRRPVQKEWTEQIFGASHVPFLCNVCGTVNILPHNLLTREDGHCRTCHCYCRIRSMIYAVTAQFSPGQPVLAWMAPRKNILGVGCSDWGYIDLLAEKFDYVNTFYDHEPRLDLCNVDDTRWKPGSIDFITCSDVLEHVEPPVHRVFDGIYRLLKPGGVAILTVPITPDSTTREHFPNLYDWRIAEENDHRVLINRQIDGHIERFDDLCFHGGDGMTLEFRVFSRQGLIDNIQAAGLHVTHIYDQPLPSLAIPLSPDNFVLVAQKESYQPVEK